MKFSFRVLFLAFIFLPLSLVHAQDSDEESERAAEAAEVIAEEEGADEVQPETDSEQEPADSAEAQDQPEEQSDGTDEDQAAETDEDQPAETDEDQPAETDEDQQAGPSGEEASADAQANGEVENGSPEVFQLQGHPAFTPEQARLVYQPLVDYLNDVTPYRFELLIAEDFHRYWLDIRRGGSPDLTLEEAHMTAYRMDRNDYTPLVKAEEPLTYSLLSATDNPDPSLRDLVGQRVSSMPAPSLGYLVLSRWYDNPMQQPIIQSNASSWRDAIEIVFSMEAEAAMAPHTLVERYVNLQPVETSQEFPGITISAAPSMPEDIQQEIREALLVLHDDEDHYEALHELDIDRFVEASAAEYEGLDEFLSEIITAR